MLFQANWIHSVVKEKRKQTLPQQEAGGWVALFYCSREKETDSISKVWMAIVHCALQVTSDIPAK